MKTNLIKITSISVLLAGASAQAITLDLTTAGSSGSANGGFFQQVADQSTGTGVIDPFLRIQNGTSEAGFNTSLNDPMPDVKTGIWTHDILLSAIPIVNISGKSYYQILLDINQTGANPLLSLNALQIWLKTGTFTGAGAADEYTDLTGGATKVWDLDVGVDGDSRIDMDYSLNSGSGSGDMFAYIPVSAVGTDGTKNLYVYSEFGAPGNPSNDGFEEWAVVGTPTTTTVPDGGLTVILLGAGFAALGAGRRFLKL
jgi:hypothetical protein